MKKVLLFALTAASTAMVHAQDLPPGAARDLVQQNCQSCHTLARIQSKQYNLEQWTATVHRMQSMGAQLTDAQVKQVAEYLAANYGPATQTQDTKPSEQSTAPAPQYVTSDADKKLAVLTVIAGQGNANGGLNFNGVAKGERTFTVPLGWTVELKFSNAGQMPHNAILIAGTKVPNDLGNAKAAFPGAVTKVARADDAPQTVRFRAAKAGDYLLVCGVGQHGARGQFVKFVVSADAKSASFK